MVLEDDEEEDEHLLDEPRLLEMARSTSIKACDFKIDYALLRRLSRISDVYDFRHAFLNVPVAMVEQENYFGEIALMSNVLR